MAEKLELVDILAALDRKDVDFYSNLSVEEQKQIQPFVLMRFLSGTYNKRQVMLVNTVINPYCFTLNNDKDLLWKLLTICTSGKRQKYFWNKPNLTKSDNPVACKVIQEYFGYNSHDASNALKLLSKDDIISMAEEMGWQDEETNKIRKEFDLPLLKISSVKGRKKTTKVINPDLIEL